MCGRVCINIDPEELARVLGVDAIPAIPPADDVPPGSMLPVIREKGGQRVLSHLLWGLIPSWAKDAKIGWVPAFSMAKGKILSFPAGHLPEGEKRISGPVVT